MDAAPASTTSAATGAGGGAGATATSTDGKGASGGGSGASAAALISGPATVTFSATCGTAVGSSVPLPLSVNITARSAACEDVIGERAAQIGAPSGFPSDGLVIRVVNAVKDGVDMFELGAVVGSMKTLFAAVVAESGVPVERQVVMRVKVQKPSAAEPRTCVVVSFFAPHVRELQSLDVQAPASADLPAKHRITGRTVFNHDFRAEAELGLDITLAQFLKATKLTDWPTSGRLRVAIHAARDSLKHARETFKLVATRTSGGSVRRSERDFAVLMSHFSKLLRGSISLEYDDLAEVFQDAFDVQSLPTLSRPFEDDFRAEISRGMPAKMYGNLVPFLNDIRDSFSEVVSVELLSPLGSLQATLTGFTIFPHLKLDDRNNSSSSGGGGGGGSHVKLPSGGYSNTRRR